MTATKSRKTPNTKSKKRRWKLSDTIVVALISSVATIMVALLNSPLIEKWLTQPPMSATSTATIESTPTLGIGSTMIGEDGMKMVFVPAGDFTMGSDVDDALAECKKYQSDCSRDWFTNEEPPHTVNLNAFWIDQTEVTNKQYAACVSDGGCTPPSNNSSSMHASYYGNPEFNEFPVVNVDWDQAKAYCLWTGRELPSEAQWEKAARGTDVRTYPWGNNFNGSIVNFCDKNCTFDWADKTSDDGFADTAPVGNYPNGASPYGAYDMAGNVWEWVSDWYSETYYKSSPPSNPLGPESGQYRGLRGGAWGDRVVSIVRSSLRGRINPTVTSISGGFRCTHSLP